MDQVVHAARSMDATEPQASVSLWWVPLAVSRAELERLSSHLSVDERARAAALRRSCDRDRFVAAHGWLRQLLAAELGCGPANVPIQMAAGGKPEVAGSDLCFNAARSHDLAVFAITRGTEVGVDVEAVGPDADIDRVAALFFSASERRALASLAPDERLGAAFRCWTCKEAYFKGTGSGLVGDPRAVDTWTGGAEPARVGDWYVHEVELAAGFAAALAIHNGADAVVEVRGARIK
jgi:4'-phosphopantetheinyl transferase